MNRKIELYEAVFTRKHESKMQELRQERKSEGHRLEDLKKTLQTKLHVHQDGSGTVQAA